jgi:hypothetical protein
MVVNSITALESIYPHHFSRSHNVSKGYWQDINNQRQFFNHLAASLNIKTANDWYKVGTSYVISKGGAAILAYPNRCYIVLFTV